MKSHFTKALVLCSLVFLLVGCIPPPTIYPSSFTSTVTPTATTTPSPTVTITPTPTDTETPTPTNTSIPPITVLITSLYDGADIPQTIDIVEGEYQNVPQDKRIWLYVYATYIKKYYLLPIDLFNDGRWQVRKVIVGASDEQGTKYKIGVIAVDLQDNKRLESNSFELSDLPASTQLLTEIIVYRE